MHYLIKSRKDVDSLVSNQVGEGLTLDYKQKLPNLEDAKQKTSFLKDICALANTLGGEIVFGVEEERGTPKSICGVLISDADELKLQLYGVISTGIEPRVSGVNVEVIEYKEGIFLLIVKVPASWNAPHWVSFQGQHKFYGRHSAGNYEYSHPEIKDKFNMANLVADRIKAFRDKRVHDILRGKAPVVLNEGDGPKVVLHIIPLSAFLSTVECSILEMEGHFRKNLEFFFPLGARGIDKDITLEGLLTIPSRQVSHRAYTHFYRQGIVEAVASLPFGEEKSGEKIIPSTGYEDYLIKQKYLDILRELNFVPPFYYFLSLINVKGFLLNIFYAVTAPGFGTLHYNQDTARKPYNENEILLGGAVVDSFDDSQEKIFRSMFDQLCNAWGFLACPHFNADGSYRKI